MDLNARRQRLLTIPAEHIRTELRAFILEAFPSARKSELHDDTLLLESGIVDSLGVLELVSFMADRFAIKVSDDDFTPENFHTISTLTAFVISKGSVRDVSSAGACK